MIRKVKLTDAHSVAKICISELGYDCDENMVKKRINRLNLQRECVFIYELNKEIVGFVHVEKYELLYSESMVNILGLAVLKKYHRHGIGRNLMIEVEKWANYNNINKIRVNSGGTRKQAHEFYRNSGFNIEKEQKRFIKTL